MKLAYDYLETDSFIIECSVYGEIHDKTIEIQCVCVLCEIWTQVFEGEVCKCVIEIERNHEDIQQPFPTFTTYLCARPHPPAT